MNDANEKWLFRIATAIVIVDLTTKFVFMQPQGRHKECNATKIFVGCPKPKMTIDLRQGFHYNLISNSNKQLSGRTAIKEHGRTR